MEFTGLPLHPLVVHAAVVLVPLAVLSAAVTALAPGWRWLSRWSTLLLTGGALVAVLLARQSGAALLADRPFLTSPESTVRELVQTHQERANLLTVAMVALTVVVVVAFWLLPAPTGLASGRLDHPGSGAGWVRVALPAALVVLGLVALVLVVLTGDAGSRAVWGGG
jgi:uncharacterized membrane protein